MERQLTVRQRRFAAGIASGLSRTKAYAAAYPNNMKRSTLETAAKQAAKNPRVKAEIDRLSIELLPQVKDMRAAYEHAFCTILKLSIESRNDRLRFDAARWVCAEFEKRQQLTRSAPTVSVESLLDDLRDFCERESGRGTEEEPLVLEAVAQDEALEPLVKSQPEPAGPGAAAPDSEPAFQVVCVPGRFPPAYRKVRVR
jgi:hypothetical protein